MMPFTYRQPQGLDFASGLTHVVILDGRGRVLWEAKVRPEDKPSWDGFDPFGSPVPTGSYLCKITDDKGETIYIPFVFLR